MTPARPEVIVVDDRLTLRRGIELLLREAGLGVAGVAGTQDAPAVLRRRRHDVVLLEIASRRSDPLALARNLVAHHRVVLCTADTGANLHAAAALGAPGFVLSSSAPQALLDALRVVAAGGTYIDPELTALLTAAAPSSRLAALTPRERQILGLLAEGDSGPEIAARLVLSIETVRTHIGNAVAKLDARTRVQAVAMLVAGDQYS